MKIRCAVLALVALFLLPLHSAADSGHAAYYGSGYSPADWYAICQQHVGWGDSSGSCAWSDYWCVKPGYLPGDYLTLYANGTSLTCEVGDTVQTYDVSSWESQYVIEVNWDAFVALGLVNNNSVSVGAESPPDVYQAPIPADHQCFDATGHCVKLGFYTWWINNGGVRNFGLPLTDEFTAKDTGLTTQVFERVVLENDPSASDGWQIRGRFVTTDPHTYTPEEAWKPK